MGNTDVGRFITSKWNRYRHSREFIQHVRKHRRFPLRLIEKKILNIFLIFFPLLLLCVCVSVPAANRCSRCRDVARTYRRPPQCSSCLPGSLSRRHVGTPSDRSYPLPADVSKQNNRGEMVDNKKKTRSGQEITSSKNVLRTEWNILSFAKDAIL